jgi:hypothetical protein
MQRFARWHIWLGWLVGFPVLMWTVTGLFMAAKPIEEVRGEHLRAPSPVMDARTLIFPNRMGEVRAVSLVAQPDGPAWVVTEADGGQYRYSAIDGTLIPPMIDEEARRIAASAYAGDSSLESVTYFPADASPSDLRAGMNSWQAHYADGTNIYMNASTGEVLAVRTQWWRAYDLMWGLHIMDLKTRENAHHPILLVFAVLSVLGASLGCALMFRRRKAKVKVG